MESHGSDLDMGGMRREMLPQTGDKWDGDREKGKSKHGGRGKKKN